MARRNHVDLAGLRVSGTVATNADLGVLGFLGDMFGSTCCRNDALLRPNITEKLANANQVKDLRCLMTLVDGEVVYASPDYSITTTVR